MRSHLLFVAAILAGLGCASASAATYSDGEFYSYDQNSWGADPSDGPPASLLAPNFFTIFSSGFELGYAAPGGFVVDFSSADALSTYLPQAGAPGALNASLTDPTSSSSGIFGGEVAALRLNIAFNDAGPFSVPGHGTIFNHPPGVAFGDLILTGYGGELAGVNGLTVRQAFDVADVLLGGGPEPYAIGDFTTLTDGLNTSFEGGFASTYADDHLLEPASTPPGVPEPASWVLLIAGVAMSGMGLRRARRQAPRITASQR